MDTHVVGEERVMPFDDRVRDWSDTVTKQGMLKIQLLLLLSHFNHVRLCVTP